MTAPKVVSKIGFTLIELLVCVAIIGLLVALMFPTLRKAISAAKTAQCVSNHRSVVKGLVLYAAENDGRLPSYGPAGPGSSTYWLFAISPYMGLPGDAFIGISHYRCPEATLADGTTVGVNFADSLSLPAAPFNGEGDNGSGTVFPGSMKLSQVSSRSALTGCISSPGGQFCFLSPNKFPLTTDSDGDGIKDSNPYNMVAFRHAKCGVFGLADGSVRIVTKAQWGLNDGKIWGP